MGECVEMKKNICFSIPCYNEEENVEPLVSEIIKIFQQPQLQKYNCSIEFIDNHSTDHTRQKLRNLCEKYPENVKVIFNARNFGGVSNYYGLLQTRGECSIVLPCDFQVPLAIIPELISKWEAGAKIVCAVKESSNENHAMWGIRKLYYKLVKQFSNVEQIEHFTGSGLYDKSFITWLNALADPMPSLRGLVVEYGCGIEKIYYKEQKRRTGKSKQTFLSLFNVAIKNLVTYSQLLPHMATFVGFALSIFSVIVGVIYLILKLLYWNEFSGGIAPILFGVFFLGGIQLAFLGIIGEYLMLINQRLLNRPLVIEEERLNYSKNEEE